MKAVLETIQQLELELIEAIKHSDIEVLDRLMHPDLLFIAPDGTIVTKQLDLESHKSGSMEVDYLVPTFESFSNEGDTAISIVSYKTGGRMLGELIQGTFRYIRFWKNVNGRFQIIGGSCTKLS